MLSILIPVYNIDIQKLVLQINEQCIQAQINYEIILLDDASQLNYKLLYQELKPIKYLRYFENECNKGRSFTRNRLAQLAQYDWLLFLDCDVQILNTDFIKIYCKWIQSNSINVIHGSCTYTELKPQSMALILHWKYGQQKENLSINKRISRPYDTFHSVNFLVKKEILIKFPFDETIEKYGYEDCLWAQTLKKNHIQILPIENEVLHLGLYSGKIFLRKTASGIKNLIQLELQHKKLNTRLEKTAQLILNICNSQHLLQWYKIIERKLIRNLLGANPSLFYLDIYKLGLYLRFKNKYRIKS